MPQPIVLQGNEDLKQVLTAFINTWPLYTPFVVEYLTPRTETVELPATILRYCPRCQATPTWNRRDPDTNRQGGTWDVKTGSGYVTGYICTHCRERVLRLWYHVDNQAGSNPQGLDKSILRKLGQSPAQSIDPAPEVERGLPPDALPLYKKGLTSLSHGFGIGALGYLRRVVEDTTTHLIDFAAERAESEGEPEAAARLQQAREAHNMDDRLRAAAAALPATLRPGGINPLSILYDRYSRGIHGLSDDECIDVAQRLQFALDYVFQQWRRQLEEADTFRREIQRWTNPSVVPAPRVDSV